MPIYEYKCLKCNNEFELMQKFSDEPASRCPKCGGQVKKLVSHSSFHLKGSGWYLTDYGRKNTPPDTSENNESKTEAPPKTDTAPSSDSKD